MLSSRVKKQLENNPEIVKGINYARYGRDWSNYPRTVFEGIARKINQAVTQLVKANTALVTECMIIGQDELDSLFFRNKLKTVDDFIDYLGRQGVYKTFNWISGKTLQAYWNNGNPKDKKYNVLLAYLNIDVAEWDDWKFPDSSGHTPPTDARVNISLLKKYYLGCYYRYYQKTDESSNLIKVPLVIREDVDNGVIVETKTIGHRYRSTYVAMRDGALYIDCENLDWNERESHIFNIGFETNPNIILGISNTLDRRKQAIAIKNVLVKQSLPFDYSSIEAVEIPFSTNFDHPCEEQSVLQFFLHNPNNVMHSGFCYSMDELQALKV